MQEVAKYQESLATCAIEGNGFAQKHLNNCKNMHIIDRYEYLKKVFDELKSRTQ